MHVTQRCAFLLFLATRSSSNRTCFATSLTRTMWNYFIIFSYLFFFFPICNRSFIHYDDFILFFRDISLNRAHYNRPPLNYNSGLHDPNYPYEYYTFIWAFVRNVVFHHRLGMHCVHASDSQFTPECVSLSFNFHSWSSHSRGCFLSMRFSFMHSIFSFILQNFYLA